MLCNKLINTLCIACIIFFSCNAYASDVPIAHFPIKNYSQDINEFLPTTDTDYTDSLLTQKAQLLRFAQFYKRYFDTDADSLSPWSSNLVEGVIPYVKKIEVEYLETFNNENNIFKHKHYGENFKEHDAVWFNKIKQNLNIDAMDAMQYHASNRAIATNNTYARGLPDVAPDFFHFTLPGQGFPFDNLQESSVWAGTPLYVLHYSKDKAWALVLTPDDYFAWVKTTDIALVSENFIKQWQSAAKKSLIAIGDTAIPVLDNKDHFRFMGFIGAIFPAYDNTNNNLETPDHVEILIPVKNIFNRAAIAVAKVPNKTAINMPLTASKKNISHIITKLQNRPYGWGGAFFFNDCSQEIKSLLTPFGIWLPRNSLRQTMYYHSIDLSEESLDTRLKILTESGHPLMTLIYIDGHIMLYVGNKNINNKLQPITYQNVWGLSPTNKDKRYVIGESVFLPLLKSYPENPEIDSLANKEHFKLIFIDNDLVNPNNFSDLTASIDND